MPLWGACDIIFIYEAASCDSTSNDGRHETRLSNFETLKLLKGFNVPVKPLNASKNIPLLLNTQVFQFSDAMCICWVCEMVKLPMSR